MEKIKSLLSPGSSKDDELMYGNEEARRKESLANPTEQQPPKLYPVEGAAGQKQSGGILSQITNPDGAKYDERAFGTTATTNPDPNKLHTDPDTKSHTVLNQIVNPDGRKYDEQKFGETATTVGAEQDQGKRGSAGVAGVIDPNTRLETDSDHKKDHSILRQILNPGGKNRDDVAYGTTAHASGDKVDTAHTDRSEPLGSTVAAAGASTTLADRSATTGQTNPTVAGPAYSETRTSRVTPGYGETNTTGVATGRGEPVITGVGASTAPKYNEPQSEVLDRSHPLRDGSGAAAGHINPVAAPEASMTQPTSQSANGGLSSAYGTAGYDASRSADSHINPVGAPSTTDSAVLGTAAVAAGGLAASSRSNDTGANAYGASSQSSNLAGATYGGALGGSGSTTTHHPPGTKLDCDGNPERGYIHHVSGPHSTDIANQLDPAISGTSTSVARDRDAIGGGVVGGSALGSSAAIPATTSSNTTGVSSSSGYPTNTATTGVASSSGYPTNTSATGSSTVGSSHPSHSETYAGASQSLQDPIHKETGHAHKRVEHEHDKQEKPSLLQKILHPGGHKEEKHTSYDEHGDQRTSVDDHGRNVLHKKSVPQDSQAAAGPDWDAVQKSK